MPKKFESFYLSSKTTDLYSFKAKHIDIEIIPIINESNIPESIIVTLKDAQKQVSSNSLAYQNNEYYQSIVENSLNAFFLAKPDGVLLEANKAACELFGYSIEEFRRIGRQGIIDHSEANISQKIKERITSGKLKTELIGIKKNGQRFPLEVNSVIFLNENGEQRSSTSIIDITDRKKQRIP